MALEFMDGFDHYSDGYAPMKWDTNSSTGQNLAPGRFGGRCWKTTNANLFLMTGGQLAAITKRTVGFAFMPLPNSTAQPFFAFTDGGSTQLDLRFTAGTKIQVTRAGTALGTTTDSLAYSVWVYIEFQATIDPTAGSFILKVWGSANPGEWLNVSGVNTRATANSTMNGISFPAVSFDNRLDDIYCLNPSGSINNDFLGECRIHTAMPTGDNTTSPSTNKLWTPNSGTTHYTQVDDPVPPDSDTTYVASSTVDHIDTFQFADIAPIGGIAAVQVVLMDRKDDIGLRTIRAVYRSGAGSNYDGAATFLPSTGYLMHRQMYDTDPATGAAWTLAGLNAGEFGVKLVA